MKNSFCDYSCIQSNDRTLAFLPEGECLMIRTNKKPIALSSIDGCYIFDRHTYVFFTSIVKRLIFVIKVILMLQDRTLSEQLHYQTQNWSIPAGQLGIARVSSFSFTGVKPYE